MLYSSKLTPRHEPFIVDGAVLLTHTGHMSVDGRRITGTGRNEVVIVIFRNACKALKNLYKGDDIFSVDR